MKSLKKLISSSVLAVTLMFATSFAANAIVITQDIFISSQQFEEFQLGTIQVETSQAYVDNAIDNGFLLDSDFGEISLLSINLFGLPTPVFQVFDFIAQIDPANLFAGIEYLQLDLNEIGFDDWGYQIVIDTFNNFGFIEINDPEGVFFEGNARLGVASVVSSPATVALLTLAMVALFTRRKRIL